MDFLDYYVDAFKAQGGGDDRVDAFVGFVRGMLAADPILAYDAAAAALITQSMRRLPLYQAAPQMPAQPPAMQVFGRGQPIPDAAFPHAHSVMPGLDRGR